ncbi:hypothetical protein [Simiduia agarivorans]|uniref:MSHA biogenesis protein MshK n=1 Tax=Simiduia agarivorans (strain DSM 21679 / JCM 13881 / BCRC 17597 / SA1) TaxID=1117647 RepID=R9S3F0_SIMAS|nr:hypothetical protein [Simiduia agarivorans]AGN11342.1 hypothetical protein M5M_13412 [Simiduia agarivorans SA1 = DSM 21679]
MIKHITIAFLVSIFLFSSGTLAKNSNSEDKKLPPGLEKKLEKGEALPPGWQKKLIVGHRLDDGVYRRGRVIHRGDNGEVTIEVEDEVIRVIENTREILEILTGKHQSHR